MIMSAVHPWLMSLRGDILEAKSQQLRQPLPTEFIVNSNAPDALMITDKEQWIRRKRIMPPIRL